MSNKKGINFSYKEVQKKIKKDIISGKYKDNKKIPSERNLCEIFGVSRTTIRKAIDSLVKDNYLLKRPGKGTFIVYNRIINNSTNNSGFTHNSISNNITDNNNVYDNNKAKVKEHDSRKSDTGNIVFLRCVHTRLTDNNSTIKDDIFYPEVFAGIDSYLSKKNYHCIFKYVYEQDLEERVINDITSKSEGIICAELHKSSFQTKLKACNLPLVLVNPSIVTTEADVVCIDDFTGGYKAAEYLQLLGHKKVAFIGGPMLSFSSKYRKQGFVEALNRRGIDIGNLSIAADDWRLEDGYLAALKLLDFSVKPTAIFAASDLLAIGAINAIKDSGLHVPGDISVLGFDDIEMASQIRPALTTMRVRKNAIGETAAELIFDRLISKRDFPLKVSIPSVLLERESVNET
ncbi:MAG: GntR family transcriptional regulator [bacterium]